MHDDTPTSRGSVRPRPRTGNSTLAPQNLASLSTMRLAEQAMAASGLKQVAEAATRTRRNLARMVAAPVVEQVQQAASGHRLAETALKPYRDLHKAVTAPMVDQMKAASGLSEMIETISRPQRELQETVAKAFLSPPVLASSSVFDLVVSQPIVPVPAGINAYFHSYENLARQILIPFRFQEEALAHVRQLLQPIAFGIEGLLHEWLRPLRYWGRRCYRAACAAMESAHRGDLDAIRHFIRSELGLPPTKDRVQALSVALLAGDWDEKLNIDDNTAVRSSLRKKANEYNELVGDHTVGGRRVAFVKDSLDLYPTVGPGTDQQALDSVEQWDDPRLPLVLERLTPEEWEVALSYAEKGKVSWEQAAIACGREPRFGERVRRKLKREGKVITARQALLGH